MSHIVIWRLAHVKRHVLLLTTLFLLLPTISWLAVAFLTDFGLDAVPSWLTHVSLSLSYIAIYPAFQASSPTLHLVESLHFHPMGMTREAILAKFATDSVVADRLNDLEASGLLKREGANWRLSKKGACLNLLFRSYRSFLGLPEGAG